MGPKKPPWLDFRAGENIFELGERAGALFIVQDGEIAIIKRKGDAETVVSSLGKGDFFGGSSPMEDAPRTTTARAKTDCRLLRIDISLFPTVLKERPEIAVRIIHRLSSQLDEVYEQLAKIHSGTNRSERPGSEGGASDE